MPEPVTAELLHQLVESHASALEWYAGQWTEWAEDCVQEAFIQLAGQPVAPPNLEAWLYRVVRNRALNARRAEVRRNHHERLAAMLMSRVAGTDDRENLKSQLRACLGQLSEMDQEVIVLRIWSQLTWQEVADLCGTSCSSAHRNYVAALTRLKNIMEPSCKTISESQND